MGIRGPDASSLGGPVALDGVRRPDTIMSLQSWLPSCP